MIQAVIKDDFQRLLQIWESAVCATHTFLKEGDFEYIKSRILSVYFPQVDLYKFVDDKNNSMGFMGVSGNKLEMLFVDNSYRGRGIGSKLLEYAIHHLKVSKVDVNEQNTQALDFYQKHSFTVCGRSENDAENLPYPILHMTLKEYS